ncbi:hypothetical protein PsorP6_006818 [Peronosclerospora sorghi]|uniref:Uncharacterized protein n=1 Tax=Peronosclerospora sorghi TaxID=230839 RepID=A0ACC0W9M9_9STRA|nr:hypothetical protein PsorP6_006818 [Peronosclerospora sorghi]
MSGNRNKAGPDKPSLMARMGSNELSSTGNKISVKESSLGDPKQYAVRAIQGFFRSISFGHMSYDVTKDVLRLLTLWFAQVRRHNSQLVYEADMVSGELIRVAIFWNELWHGALKEVSMHFFNNRDVAAMIAELAILHEQMDQIGTEETTTLREVAFYQAFSRDLKYANEWTNVYERTKKWTISIRRGIFTKVYFQEFASSSPTFPR